MTATRQRGEGRDRVTRTPARSNRPVGRVAPLRPAFPWAALFALLVGLAFVVLVIVPTLRGFAAEAGEVLTVLEAAR